MQVIVLCLDVSESMSYGKPTKLDQAVKTALKAVEGLSLNALIGLVAFDTDAEVVLDLQPANLENVRAQLRELSVRGVSCIAGGVIESVRLIEKDHPSGAILLLTDGRANLSLNRSGGFEGSLNLEKELLSISEEAKRKNITIHAISVGEDAFTQTLSGMAEKTQGFHWIAEDFERLDSRKGKLQSRVEAKDLRVHAAPAELPSAQPTWAKESQFMHVAVVSQGLYESYEPNHVAFLVNLDKDREARTAVISTEDESLVGYRERRPKTVEQVRDDTAILLDRSYRDYLDLGENGSLGLFIY